MSDRTRNERMKRIEVIATEPVLHRLHNMWNKLKEGRLVTDANSKVSYQPADGWDDAIHQYFHAILTEEIRMSGNISCLTDQILCLGALRIHSPLFGFQCANAFTIRCSALQHNLYSMLVQAVRLHEPSGGVGIYQTFRSAPGTIAVFLLPYSAVDVHNNLF